MARHHSIGRNGGNGAADSLLAETKAALVAIAAEADELQQTVGGSITEAVAGWLAPHYAVAARERLVALEGEDRLKLLRAFVQDWALLRHGDQTAERLRIERERLATVTQDADLRWKRKTIIGLEVLMAYVKKHPEAQSAFDELCRQVRHPFDLREQNLGNPTKSD
jgi:hypothetical protein